jgi:O-antigen ligase
MLTVGFDLLILSLPLADLLLFPSMLVGAGQPSTFLAPPLFAALLLSRPGSSFRVLLQDRHSRLFLAFLGVSFASGFMSAAAPLTEWKGEVLWVKSLKQCLQLGLSYCCFAIPLLYLNSSSRWWRALRLYCFTLALAAAYGLLELLHYLGAETGIYPLLADLLHFGSFFGSAATPNLVFLPSLQGFPRLRLLASEPSMAGNYLLSVVPLAFLLALRRGGWRWWVIAGAGVALLFLTFSLGAWIALACAVPTGLLLLWRDRRRVLKVLTLAAIAAVFFGLSGLTDETTGALSVPGEVLRRLTRPEGDISVSGRMLENRTAWEIFTAYPLLGAGIGNWVFHYPGRMSNIPNNYIYFREQVSPSSNFQRAAGINNLFLRLLCETGLFGFGVFTFFLISLGRTLFALARGAAAGRPLATGLAMAYLALVLHFNSLSAFDKRYWWFLFGMIAAAGRLFLSRPRYGLVLAAAPGGRAKSPQLAGAA